MAASCVRKAMLWRQMMRPLRQVCGSDAPQDLQPEAFHADGPPMLIFDLSSMERPSQSRGHRRRADDAVHGHSHAQDPPLSVRLGAAHRVGDRRRLLPQHGESAVVRPALMPTNETFRACASLKLR